MGKAMVTPSLVRWCIGGIGGVLILLNALHLTVGFARLQRALTEEPIPDRFAEPLKTAWLYLGSVSLLLGVLLLWLLPEIQLGRPAAWKAVVWVGLALVATGISAYLATRNHPGLLFLCLLGLVLLIPLLYYRDHFQ